MAGLTTVTGGGIKDGTITNADINASAAIDASKVSGLSTDSITEGNTTVEVVDTGSDGHITFDTEGTERMRIDNNGVVIVNATTARADFDNGTTNRPIFQLESGVDEYDSSISLVHNENSGADSSTIFFGKTRAGAVGGTSALNDVGYTLGKISFQGYDGTNFVEAARIEGKSSDSPGVGADDMPGELLFFTTADAGTSATERMRIDSSGNVGIGTTSPSTKLEVEGDNQQIRCQVSDSKGVSLYGGSSSNTPAITYDETLRFFDNGSGDGERLRIDSSGRLLLGTSSTRTVNFWDTPQVQIEGTNYQESSLSIYNNQDFTYGAVLALGHSRGTSLGSNTVVQNNDYLGTIAFYGSDGSDERRGAEICAFSDGTPGSGDMPGRLVFSTTADGSSSPTEQMRIDSGGTVYFGNFGDVANAGYINKATSGDFELKLSSTRSTAVHRDIRFFTRSDVESMRIQSTGGISFNGDTAAANALDDYEEGTWTPSFHIGGTAANISYGFSPLRVGTYVKIGRQVTVTFEFEITNRGAGNTGACSVDLPFGVSELTMASGSTSTSNGAFALGGYLNTATTSNTITNIFGRAQSDTNRIELRWNTQGDSDERTLTEVQILDSFRLSGTCTYFTDS